MIGVLESEMKLTVTGGKVLGVNGVTGSRSDRSRGQRDGVNVHGGTRGSGMDQADGEIGTEQ